MKSLTGDSKSRSAKDGLGVQIRTHDLVVRVGF